VGCSSLFPSSDPPAPGPQTHWTTYKVQLNSIGFLPDRAKVASVVPPGGTMFNVVRVDDQSVAWSGPLTGPVGDPDTGDQVWIADFTAFTDPGDYTIEVPDVGGSPPFKIASDLYADALRVSMLGFTGARCGTAVSFTQAGETFKHKACHLGDGYVAYLGDGNGKKDGTGGWHDAGDYGKYMTNGAFAVGMLLEAWDHFQPTLSALSMQIPEHGGAIPDYLAEVKWELEWFFTMQQDDGSVSFKLTALNFESFIMPESDGSQRYFVPAGTGATADFVAVMAMAARIYQPYDTDFAARCRTAAEAGYTYLGANPAQVVPDESQFHTGGYEDDNDADERLWAAAEMWETSGDPAALADFEMRAGIAGAAIDYGFDWPHVGNLGYFTYALSKRDGRNADLVTKINGALSTTADAITTQSSRHPYGRGLPIYYWGSAAVVARNSMNLWVAGQLTTDPAVQARYADATVAQLDYVLGRNPFGRSWVTGMGYHPPLHPHHRPSAADNINDNPWPGMLVSGPKKAGNDPKLAWDDTQADPSMNEVAINWTAAFVYGIAALTH
jgi:endoglucanase